MEEVLACRVVASWRCACKGGVASGKVGPFTAASTLLDSERCGCEDEKLLRTGCGSGTGECVVCGPSVCVCEPVNENLAGLFRQRAWELSITPLKNQGPSVFMAYMMGGSGVFAVVFLGFMLLSAVKALLAGPGIFDEFQKSAKHTHTHTFWPRVVYLLLSLGFVLYFGYRTFSLFPLGDATSFIPPSTPRQLPPFKLDLNQPQ